METEQQLGWIEEKTKFSTQPLRTITFWEIGNWRKFAHLPAEDKNQLKKSSFKTIESSTESAWVGVCVYKQKVRAQLKMRKSSLNAKIIEIIYCWNLFFVVVLFVF